MCEYDARVGADPHALTLPELADGLVAFEVLRRRLDAAEARYLRVFDARQGADADGAASTACWLRDRTGATDREARQRVGLARSLDRLPLLAAAFGAGAVTAAHARVLAGHTKRLDPGTVAAGEPHLVRWARELDAQRFAAVVRRWVATVAPAEFERDTESRYDARWLSVAQTFGGMTSVSGMLEPEGGGILTAALDALVSANPSDDVRSRDQQRADALVDLVELARSHDLLPVAGGNRPEIIVHAPVAALATGADDASDGRAAAARASATAGAGSGAAAGAGSGAAAGAGAAGAAAGTGGGTVATLAGGHPLTPGALDRLGCDARFRRLLVDPVGVPLDLGRATRLVPPALRKHVALRDGGCRYPGCPRPAAYCEAHHAVFWRHGGRTSAGNLVLLCRYHHHLVHDRHHDLTLLPDARVRVTTPAGRVLSSRPRGPTAVPV